MPKMISSLFLFAFISPVFCQLAEFPVTERFDSVRVPELPPGWISSTNRAATGDFTTTHSAPHSDSSAALSTNAAIAQWLATPALDFRGWAAESLSFYERRSGTHNSGVLVEASTDRGVTFAVVLSETLLNPGTTAYVRRAMLLPPTFGTTPDVRLRWRIIGNGTGTTGTYRLDDVAVKARGRKDLSLVSLALDPEYPLSGSPVRLAAVVRNEGLDTARGFSAEFFADLDHDLLPDEGELLGAELAAIALPPGDSVALAIEAGGSSAPSDTIIGVADYPGDQFLRNNRKILRRTTGVAPGAVVVNEIMYAPAAQEPEWIEISAIAAAPVDVGSWGISDRNASTVYAFPAGPLLLEPGSFAVVTKDSAKLASVHPGLGRIIGVPNMPTSLFNNDSDAVVLSDHRGARIDSVHYRLHWGGREGVSLERVEPSGASSESSNWGSSPAAGGSTPGRQNFLTPLDTNVRAVRIALLHSDDSTRGAGLVVQNIGRTNVLELEAFLFLDRNNDSSASSEEFLSRVRASAPLPPGDSVLLQFPWEHPDPGTQMLLAAARAEHDMRADDDRASLQATFSYPRRSLTLNEIMYDPLAGKGEYLEYLNRGPLALDVRTWRLGALREAASALPGSAAVEVLPGEYLVIASDSSVLSAYPGISQPGSRFIALGKSLGLGNSGDAVMLFDATGRMIDSVRYWPSWHNPDLDETRGRSLERISPAIDERDSRNWSTSADPSGGTPGRRNSLYTPASPGGQALSCSPNPFSPDGDGLEDATMIFYELPFSTGTIRVSIFDVRGRKVRTLAAMEPTGKRGEIIWDGRDDRSEKVPMGIYVILLEGHDALAMSTETMKGIVVVAAKL